MRYAVASTILALVGGGVFLLRPFGTGDLDNKALDALAKWAGPGQQSGRLIIVEIDELSLARTERWPWKRDRLALLTSRILDLGASTVVLDMMFPDEDHSRPLLLPDGPNARADGRTNDDAFAETLSGKPVAIGYTFAFDRRFASFSACNPAPLPVALAGPEGGAAPFFQATDLVCSVGPIERAAVGGFLNVAPDHDGIVRRVPMIIEYQGRRYPSLALAAISVDLGGPGMALKTDAGGARELRFDGRSIPLEGPSLLRLRFRSSGRNFPRVAACDVFEGNIPPGAMNGKIAVVGVAAAGIQDTVSTPAGPLFPGLELQATAIDNLLQGDVFSRPSVAYALELALVLLAAAVLTLLLTVYRGVWGPFMAAAVIAGVWAACAFAVSSTEALISPLPASVAAACNFSILILLRYRGEKRRADRSEQQLVSVKRVSEAALQESEHRYQRLVENVNDAIIVHDMEGRLVFANRRFREWFGLGDHDVREVTLESYVAPEWLSSVRDYHDRLVRGEAMPGNVEFEGIRADGARLWIDALVTTVEEDGRISGTQSALRDISRRKRIEAQYLQAQKMESLGRLAGGIAHDFNNLLTVISGYSDMLLSEPGHSAEVREYLRNIRQAGMRAGELTQKLLAFSRQQKAHPKALDLSEVVSDAAGMYSRLIGEDIELVTRLSPNLGLVRADPVQVNQILMNLVTNARDAMPDGGRLIIETKNLEIDQEFATQRLGIPPGSYVCLSVTDTGTGIDAETQRHIFDPFFTTKEPGKGTGLGLATVHGIVSQNGGGIRVSSKPGEGAAFHIYLPEIKDASPVMDEYGRAPIGGAMGSGTVLLVEDDDEVRRYSAAVLQRHGYRTLPASNGAEALELAEQYPDMIHLLLTDMVLPRMSGPDLAEKLKAVRPEIKVLFTSGHPIETGLHAAQRAGAEYLQKPFGPDALAAKVHDILAA